MINYDEILSGEPYEYGKEEKKEYLSRTLSLLTKHHYTYCEAYRKILDSVSFNVDKSFEYEKLPFLPVRLFKDYELKSISDDEIVKTMNSSGTSGQAASKIYLDKMTSANQTKTLVKIVSSYIGKKRLPMIILDSSAVIKNRAMFSARGAGILGFSMFARDRFFALDENMKLDVDGLKEFLKKHEGEELFLFGFTFMIWQHFYREVCNSNEEFDLSKGTLIHGGGWKKLINESVTSDVFKSELQRVCGLSRIFDYYGMVEQTGTIYMECECGKLHTSIFSDVLIRRPKDFSLADVGEEGIVEIVSVLPYSYPGHVLLTEDVGILLGEDDCPCGRKGKYFKINGRIKNAEIRGCSDTYAVRF